MCSTVAIFYVFKLSWKLINRLIYISNTILNNTGSIKVHAIFILYCIPRSTLKANTENVILIV